MGKAKYDKQLQQDVQFLIDSEKITGKELSIQLSVSKTTVSLYLRSMYPGDPSKVESKLRAWLRKFSSGLTLSAADEHRLVRIYAIIDEAQKPGAIVSRIQQDRG